MVHPDQPARSARSAAWSALQGNLAPDGAIVKIAGMKNLRFEGTALCFDCEEDAFAAVDARAYKAGDVIIIRYEGPKGGPGMREMLSTTSRHLRPGHGRQGGADHRWAVQRRHARLLHRPCRAGGGGRRADRAAAERRPDRHRRREGHHRHAAAGGRDRRAAAPPGSRAGTTTMPARCGNTRSWSARPISAP